MRSLAGICFAFIVLAGLTAGGDNEKTARLSEQGKGINPEITMETSAPDLYLQDALSSTYKTFKIQSGNYSWNFLEGNEVVSVVACGASPADEAKNKEQLEIPYYNKLEAVPYVCSFSSQPDRMTVREYMITESGEVEEEPVSEQTYQEAYIVNLQKNRIYDIFAEWDKEAFDDRGFYGEASYVAVSGPMEEKE